MSLINATSTSAFLYCTSPPATQTFYTTVYETVLPAACETSQWMATYTITETCAGNPADYVTAVVPPGFVVTTVSCPSCNPNEIEITCPGAQPTGMGKPTVAIGGNGVTATIIAVPTAAPVMGGRPAALTGAAAVPTVTAIVGQAGNSGTGSSSGSCGAGGSCGYSGVVGSSGTNGSTVSGGSSGSNGGSSSSGSGTSEGSSGSNGSNGNGVGSSNGNGNGVGSSNGNGNGVGSNNGNGNGVGSSNGNGNGVGSSNGNGNGVGSSNGNGNGVGSSNNGNGMGSSNGNGTTSVTGTAGTPPVAITGAASSLTRNLALVSGLALVAGHFFLL